MRRILMVVALAAMLAGGVASAQIIDPSTGVMVDPESDPMDFASVASGQPGNTGMELAAQATTQAQAFAAQSMQLTMQSTQLADAFPASNDDSGPAEPAIPPTPKPVMTPNGGSFKGAVQVAIADKNANAMIHYTEDGTKPSDASPLYASPITVTAKTKIRAIAVGSGELDSGVVTKTFKVKG